MNWKKVYFDLITSRQKLGRRKLNDGALEKHHIWPKSLGGDNSKENNVLLTPREHFVAHILLTRFLEGKEKAKMSYALLMMIRCNSNQTRIFTSRQYELAKRIVSKNCSGENSRSFGVKLSEERVMQLSENMKGVKNHRFGKKPWNYGLTLETSPILQRATAKWKQTVLENPSILFREPRTTKTREKISKSHLGKVKSAEHRRKIAEALKGRPLIRSAVEKSANLSRGKKHRLVTCPHCNKEGGLVAMNRWHFDSCSLVKERSPGKKWSDASRRAASERLRGKAPRPAGWHHSEETKKLIGIASRARRNTT